MQSLICGFFVTVSAVGAHGSPPLSFPVTLQTFAAAQPSAAAEASCEGSTCRARDPDQEAPQLAMLQKSIKREAAKKALDCEDGSCGRPPANTALFRWGDPEKDHPRSIGKFAPHPSIQEYEASIPYLNGMVLNIFGKVSNGDGGLMLALEVPSACGGDNWVEVDRSRCSSRYPCALHLPNGAVRSKEGQLTKFRTRVLAEDEDYLTDFLEYDRVVLDHEPEVVLAHETYSDDAGQRSLSFRLSAVLSAGALTVTPIVQGGNADTVVQMRLRQPEPTSVSALEQKDLSSSEKEMQALELQLQSYRENWASDWRPATKGIGGCDFSMFEVTADQFYPGDMELEVWVDGGVLSDVLVTSRLSWSEAEVSLLDTIMKDHFAFFNDPAEIIHGLPMDALKKENPKQLTDSNPCEWGYAMEAWIVMAETGHFKPEETVAKLGETFNTLETLQSDTNQFAHGLFYPYYHLTAKEDGKQLYPSRTDYKELPCGDDALLYASMLMVQGWLKSNSFQQEAETCARILGRMDFSHCVRKTDCSGAGNGLQDQKDDGKGDRFWSVPLTFNADTLQQNAYNWNVFADEGGVVAMVVALSGALNEEQYASAVHQQQRYSPCTTWEGVTVGHAAFFNSIFTLPTRSMLGFGTLFSAPYYHEFAVRTVLPTFRAHQKLKKKLGVDYIGPSDAMSMMPKAHPGKFFGSYAYWPPNNMYDCREGRTTKENQCTWCKGIQYEGLDDKFDMIVPHGNMASFLVSAMMEKSQFSAWIEDTKLLITDWSEVYTPGYGLEVVAPAKRTPRGGKFEGAFDGRGVYESLSHGYTTLSMYEGLATMRRRFELAKQAGLEVRGAYEPPKYKPLSDFVSALPEVRARINQLLQTAFEQKSTEKKCVPSDYGPAGQY